MAADPLSDLLKTVRLTGAVFFEIAAKEPWAVGSPPRELILPKILPGADHLIAYQLTTQSATDHNASQRIFFYDSRPLATSDCIAHIHSDSCQAVARPFGNQSSPNVLSGYGHQYHQASGRSDGDERPRCAEMGCRR
jgi:Cupin